MKNILKNIGCTVLVLLILVGGFILIAWITSTYPEKSFDIFIKAFFLIAIIGFIGLIYKLVTFLNN